MTFRDKLRAGVPLLGTFVKTPHPHVVEVLASSGLDCLCLDAEHAPFDRRDLDLCIMAARAAGMPTLVRPPSAAPEQLLNALDCGADAILVPHVRTAAEAKSVARAAHYGPGGRGYAGSSRAAGYGTIAIPDHLSASALRTVVIAQIEDLEAIEEIEAIASVEGIDALFIGRIDLTIALGCQSPDDPKVVAAVERIASACVAAKRSVGMFTSRAIDAAQWRTRGVSLFLLGSDHSFLRSGVTALRSETGL